MIPPSPAPDRLHAAACGPTGDDYSHTSGQPSTASIHHHDADQVKHNFELNKTRSKGDRELLLLDGRLPPTTTTESEERVFTRPAPSTKRRVLPPPSLTLKIPERPRVGIEWQIESRSPEPSPATHIHTAYSDVAAGYFSPPLSPDASPTSASTPVPPSSVHFVDKLRSRARSVANSDLPKLSAGASKPRVLQKMVKERRSLQSLLMPSFLHLQPQSTPLGLIPGPRTESRTASTQSAPSSSGSNENSGSQSGPGRAGARSETRRSFYGRRRSHTYSGRDSTLTSPSLASSATRMPPMPEQYSPPSSSGPTPGGRESPSSYLLDDDPFAVSPAMVAPPVNSPLQSPGFTPIHSPAYSIAHSPSTVSLSSASSTSMPGTPVFQSFGALPEESEELAQPASVLNTAVSTTPVQSISPPSPPPPTPSSPLNPNASPITSGDERAQSKERMPRSLSATLSANPLHSLPSPQSASPSRPSPSDAAPARVRPAHTRPAFAPRPSLPSLSTLSRMGAVAGEFASSLRGRKRRGRVGAGLPAEPWDLSATELKSGEQEAEEDQTIVNIAVNDGGEGYSQNENTLNEAEDEEKATKDSSGNRILDASCPSQLQSSVDPVHEVVDESISVLTSQSESEEKPSSPSVSRAAEDEDSRRTLVLANIRISNGDTEIPGTINEDSEKREEMESESALERAAEKEGDNGKAESAVGNAHGEGGISIDAEPTYMTATDTFSEDTECAYGEIVNATPMLATRSDNAPLSETRKERQDISTERNADQDADQLIEEDNSLKLGPPGDDFNLGDDLHHLAAPENDLGTSLANVGSCRIAIPGRASAIPPHVLRALTPYPFSSPRCSSPASSNASGSPQSSVEDFGVLLSSSPAFRGDQRPESLTIDPGLPNASVFINACKQNLLSGEYHSDSDQGASSSSSSSAPLPSTIFCDRGDSEIEAVETGADIDLGSAGDTEFEPEAEVPDEPPAPNYATLLNPSSPSRGFLSSPIAARPEVDYSDRLVSRSPIREGNSRIEYASSSSFRDHSLSPQHADDHAEHYIDDYDNGFDHEQNEPQPPEEEEEDDSSMLPPLSTLPEEDPVFSLTTSRERYETIDYAPPPSRSISRKASVATIASIFSMRSGSSGCASQISQSYSRNHSPAASLSTTLPISNSQTGSSSSKRVYGSSSGSTDSGRGHTLSSSVSSLRSKSSFDLRGLASGRRHGSQSSGITMLSHSSTRTKCEPHAEVHGQHKKSSVEAVSLGLRAYSGNPYAAAVQSELEGKASKCELSGTARYDDDELVIDIKREDVASSINGAILAAWNVKPVDVDAFEPGSSAGTLRPSTEQQESVRVGMRSPTMRKLDGFTSTLVREHTNGYNYSNTRSGAGKDWGGGPGEYGGGYGNGCYGQGKGGSGSDDSGNHGGPPGSGQRGRDNSRDDEENYSRGPSAYNALSSSESESESESESSTDDYGEQSVGVAQKTSPVHVSSPRGRPAPVKTQEEQPEAPIFSQLRNGRKGVFRSPITSVADSVNRARTPAAEDDDVPLAQRIPNALQAQKSIRQQVRSERERRRLERSIAPTPRTSRAPEGTISPPPQHIPVTSQDERGRTLTARIPRSAPLNAGPTALSSSQEAAMMAHRLMQPHHATRAVHRQRAKTLSGADGVPPDALTQRLLRVQARGQDQQTIMQRTSAAPSVQAQPPAYVKTESPIERASAAHPMSRRRPVSPSGGPQHAQQPPADGPVPTRTLRPMRSFHGVPREPAPAVASTVPPVPASSARRRSPSKARLAQDTDATSSGLMRNRSIKSARTSTDKNNRSEEEVHVLPARHGYSHGHVMPPAQGALQGPSPPAPITRHNIVQTRIYINDMQHFNVVGAGLDTSAKDVLDMLRQQGDLRGEERRSSSWVLYEVCHDYGMERPVRSFELVTDISGSWNKEKTMNCFMVKPSPFAQSLATIPSSIPTRSGFVDYEIKKGKWSKRWLELREHGLWISKREGKEDEFLCSLSAFDAYVITRIHKAPRGFTFAVKSTDPITLFENKADYLRVFSVPEETGIAWLEAIWRARSYILYQEKNVLFRNKSAGEGTSAGANLARSGTRKKPAQTYVNLESTGPFEPGSLLAKRAAVV
ncbi:hypothetical protein A7U60_g3866 [Sanghuangporus baumii]|uniref:PH domain-containing protein n=1 Tax=Sanghuangporus baumii TaxID=108892 RepID=A0A9Q5HZR4_SANBA|nr:hypothetical protein A7U60_g3866 [Sanghuangporus baumii]